MRIHAEASTKSAMSPRSIARVAGAFHLLTVVLGVTGELLVGKVLVPGNAAATAAGIVSKTELLRMGFGAYMVEMACGVVFTALFYVLLRPAGRCASLLAAFFGLIGIAIKTTSRVFLLAAPSVLQSRAYEESLTMVQREALALLLLGINVRGAGMALIFFGCYALITGVLIMKSKFMPRALGAITALGGVGWLVFIAPPFADRVFPVVAAVGLLGAGAMTVYLLVYGVDETGWWEQSMKGPLPGGVRNQCR